MPRINLMIADDVGLGKTIEAGLILRELLIRRRIQRVLILTPASLRTQWHDEMWSKFSLRFDIIDRASTQQLKRSMGIDANPWRSSYRAVSSYYYLRQPDVLEQFRSASQTAEGSPHLPWDLLIVDEVHNLMPSPFGEDSDLCRTLRSIAPYFEHRVFLTATPHNGRTRCFTGLMEMLDPVRFTRTDELKPAERERISQVVVRRLKREINERTNPPKFCTRLEPRALILAFSKSEKRLIIALGSLRDKIRAIIRAERGRRKVAGTFAIEILGKRLLSGPATFANSWQRCKLGLAEDEAATDADVTAAQRSLDDDTGDDQEAERRGSTATVVIGSWLRDIADQLASEIADVDSALTSLGISLDKDAEQIQTPRSDARFETLVNLIKDQLFDGQEWKSTERIVVFTEYKTTLDYLLARLRKTLPDCDDRITSLFGGMDDTAREQVKEQFNDPASSVRILLATDAASEGLNLQNTARYLLHYDCPWNPSRIEQRNGRLDRHGHPLMGKALNLLGQKRYPGTQAAVSRWTTRFAPVPDGQDALLLLHVEEIAVNELRETFHHWVRTISLPVNGGDLGDPLPHVPANQLPQGAKVSTKAELARAAEILGDVEPDLQAFIKRYRQQLSEQLKEQLSIDGKSARTDEDKRFQSRHGEVSTLIESNTIQKLEREIQQLLSKKQQGVLFESDVYLDELNRDIKLKQQEVEYRRKHYEEVRDQLSRERERIVNRLLPKRFAMHTEAQVFPLAVEVILPIDSSSPSMSRGAK